MLSPTALTHEQIDALEEYPNSLDKGARERGLRYFETGQVKKVEPYKRGVGFRADVAGTDLYRVKLRFSAGEWDGECSCPVTFDCKHCCAAALEIIAELFEAVSKAEDNILSIASAAPGARAKPGAKVEQGVLIETQLCKHTIEAGHGVIVNEATRTVALQ